MGPLFNWMPELMLKPHKSSKMPSEWDVGGLKGLVEATKS